MSVKSTEYYVERLRGIAARVGWALPEQTTSDLMELAQMLDNDNQSKRSSFGDDIRVYSKSDRHIV